MTNIGDALFTKTRQRVLGLLYGKPDKSFYTNDIVRRAAMGRGTISRELERLVSAGLLLVTQEGNQRHYRANPDNPVYHELSGIVKKTFGITDVLRQAILPLDKKLDMAFVYGSIAKGEESAKSDIDLMLIGNKLSYGEVMDLLIEVEGKLGRPVNPTLYTPRQIRNKLKSGDSFVSRVLKQDKLWIKGEQDAIKGIG